MQTLTEAERQIEELWHNLFRMHGYIEAAGAGPALQQRADELLQASFARVESVLADTQRLEKLKKKGGTDEY